jgi:hypothetical protein
VGPQVFLLRERAPKKYFFSGGVLQHDVSLPPSPDLLIGPGSLSSTLACVVLSQQQNDAAGSCEDKERGRQLEDQRSEIACAGAQEGGGTRLLEPNGTAANNFISHFLGRTRSKIFIRILLGADRTDPGRRLLEPNGTAAINFQRMHCDRGPKIHMSLFGTYGSNFCIRIVRCADRTDPGTRLLEPDGTAAKISYATFWDVRDPKFVYAFY